MPKLGESVTEGTVNEWLVQVGDQVNKYDPIADVLTDKVNAEVPSSYAGTITEIVANVGETIPVGALMCYIETSEPEAKQQTPEKMEPPSSENEVPSMKKRYSPAVLRLAEEHQIDLSSVTGTGKNGRITRKDIEKRIQEKNIEPLKTEKSIETVPSILPENRGEPVGRKGDTVIPVSAMRKTIANHMITSKQEIPHAWMQIEVDVTDLVKYRNKIKKEFKEKEGFPLTYFPFFIKAAATALKKFPQLNATWAGDHIIHRKDVHISIAVANENELLVPVIKHADEKSIKGIAKDIRDLAEKARSGSLTLEDMQGGTFTVNNTGTFGSISSMGIINHPQAALLQVETIVKRPVIINDMFAARDMINLSLSLDHRILDGLICGRFMAHMKELLENMNEDTVNIY